MRPPLVLLQCFGYAGSVALFLSYTTATPQALLYLPPIWFSVFETHLPAPLFRVPLPYPRPQSQRAYGVVFVFPFPLFILQFGKVSPSSPEKKEKQNVSPAGSNVSMCAQPALRSNVCTQSRARVRWLNIYQTLAVSACVFASARSMCLLPSPPIHKVRS